ncbi:MAG TPA: hypothetical protein VG963_26680 [Polyangiaceae bacterium]|nr:hypothetical protein [Polyangiaceae bacterium]
MNWRHRPKRCRVTYELGADYGYLSRVYHDCGQEGWGINVVCFEADTLDLDACRASVR